MPINRRWPIADLIAACREFPTRNGRRITFEYVLLAGVNDSLDDARRLADLVRGIPAKVNLIPYNANPGLPFQAPPAARRERLLHVAARGRLRRPRLAPDPLRSPGGRARRLRVLLLRLLELLRP